MSLPNNPITSDVLMRACALFDRCVDLPPTQRAALLDEECPEPQLAHLLQAMLVADSRSDDPFATPAVVWAAQLEVDSLVLDGFIGQSVGGFRILSRLGEGGSSVVFAAERDVAGGTQQVALKLLQTGLFSAKAQRRFRREQAILAQLTHPNIAHLIDAGVSSAGIPYIAMERIDGRSLLADARARNLDLPARLRLLAEVALAVDAAHRALVVHRDLKPANILIDQAGRVKVLDFGIAKLIDENESTQTQQIALTPGYAAPEQYHPGVLTTAVDVYALGVIGAELAIDARLGPDARVPPGPEADTQRSRWQALDADLATVLSKALAEEPLRRYASARHLADDIERYLAREPIAAHPPSRTYRARKFMSRHRIGLAVTTAIIAILLAAFGLVLTQRNLARQQASRADSMRDFMFDAFAEAEPSVPHDGPVTVLDAVHRAIVNSENNVGSDAHARLELRARLAQVLERQGDMEGATKLLDQTLAEARTAFGTNNELTQEIAELQARNTMARGQFDAARLQIDTLLRQVNDDRSAQRVELLSLSSLLASKLRDRTRALDEGRRAMALARGVGDPELLRQTVNSYAVVLLSVDAIPEAVSVYEELLILNRQLFGNQHQKVATVQNGLSRAYRRLGDMDRAESAARAAIEIDRKIYSGANWKTASHLNSLMLVLDAKGELNSALEAALEALQINRVTLGDDHPETLGALYGLGSLEIKRESYAAAVPLLQEALIGTEKQFGAKHWSAAVRRAHYGFALAMTGALDAGTQALEQAIADIEALADPDIDQLSGAIEMRVRLSLHSRDHRAAGYWIGQLERYSDGAPVRRASWPGNVACLRGETYLAAGKAAEAIAALTRAGALIDSAADVSPLLRAEHSVLLATAMAQSGHEQRAIELAQTARRHLRALQYVPQRLARLEAALPQ
jgi:eukaryotic-like serine/threonine-protein kinase